MAVHKCKPNINIHRDITSSLRLGGLSSTPAAPVGVKPKSGLVRLRFLSLKIYEIFRIIGETPFSFIKYITRLPRNITLAK